MDATHQQHVQANLNYKKRVTMQKLMEELQSQYYDVSCYVMSRVLSSSAHHTKHTCVQFCAKQKRWSNVVL